MSRLKLIYLFAVLTVFSSCVSDGCVECTTSRMTFNYRINGGANVLDQYITHATLYIYDATDGLLVKTMNLDQTALLQANGVDLDLKEGDYTVVSWANLGEHSHIVSENNLADARLRNKDFHSAQIGKSNDPIYWAQNSFKIVANDAKRVDMAFKSAYIDLDIIVKGVEQNDLTVHAFNVDSEYDFNRQLKASRQFTYKPTLTYHANEYAQKASLRLFKVSKDSPIQIEVSTKNNQKVLFDLKKILQEKYPNLDIERQEQVSLALSIEFNGIEVSVTVPSWDVDNGNVGIQ